MFDWIRHTIPGRVRDHLPVAMVAIIARSPAFASWWCLDDWGQLARAAGTLPGPDSFPARWLSQHAYWSLTWSLLGLDFVAHTAVRLLLHAVAACAVQAIAARAGLGFRRSLFAGLLFAASPIAFTPLVWASGIQELLAGCLALLAIALWLTPGYRNIAWAGLCLAGSILAKESGLGLPILFLVHTMISRPGTRNSAVWRWSTGLACLALAVWEARLISGHFATGIADPYRLGGIESVLGNLGMFGWWLITPGPVFAGQPTWFMAGMGLAVWGVWAAWALYAGRKGEWIPLAGLAVAITSLAPALPLFGQAKPYMAYLAVAAVAVVMAGVARRSWLDHRCVPAVLVIVAMAWGLGNMWLRITGTEAQGRPSDPIVLAADVARETTLSIQGAPAAPTVVVFQQPLRPADLARVREHGPTFVKPTARHNALAGEVGLALALPHDDVRWRSSIMQVPLDARVFAEAGAELEDWGSTPDALVRAAVIDLYIGFHHQAYGEIGRAVEAGMNPNDLGFDPLADGIRRDFLTSTQAAGYRKWLEGQLNTRKISLTEFGTARQRFDALMVEIR